MGSDEGGSDDGDPLSVKIERKQFLLGIEGRQKVMILDEKEMNMYSQFSLSWSQARWLWEELKARSSMFGSKEPTTLFSKKVGMIVEEDSNLILNKFKRCVFVPVGRNIEGWKVLGDSIPGTIGRWGKPSFLNKVSVAEFPCLSDPFSRGFVLDSPPISRGLYADIVRGRHQSFPPQWLDCPLEELIQRLNSRSNHHFDMRLWKSQIDGVKEGICFFLTIDSNKVTINNHLGEAVPMMLEGDGEDGRLAVDLVPSQMQSSTVGVPDVDDFLSVECKSGNVDSKFECVPDGAASGRDESLSINGI